MLRLIIVCPLCLLGLLCLVSPVIHCLLRLVCVLPHLAIIYWRIIFDFCTLRAKAPLLGNSSGSMLLLARQGG